MSPPAVLSACCVAACLLLQQRMVCACLKVLAGHMNSFICKVYLPLRNSGTTLTTSASSSLVPSPFGFEPGDGVEDLRIAYLERE